MHNTAMQHGKLFFDTYVDDRADLTIVDIGAQDVNGSLRTVAPANCKYVGVDFAEGKGVDVIIDDPYALPFDDATIDVCVSSSCFEHSEFFWLSFLEVLRILKPEGLLYLNVPSNGYFHQYPVDCWRFYPDSGRALQNWARARRVHEVSGGAGGPALALLANPQKIAAAGWTSALGPH
jgi:SAM-dependent methyltransferase